MQQSIRTRKKAPIIFISAAAIVWLTASFALWPVHKAPALSKNTSVDPASHMLPSPLADRQAMAGTIPFRLDIPDVTEVAPALPLVLNLRPHETLSGLLKRAQIPPALAQQAINVLGKISDLKRLKPDQTIELAYHSTTSDSLYQIRLRDRFDSIAIAERSLSAPPNAVPNRPLLSERASLEFLARREKIPTVSLTRYIDGTIDDSLYIAAREKGVPDSVILNFIRMMSYDVDFQRDIRAGDRFRIYFERIWAPNYKDVEEGRILHASLSLHRGDFEATLYEDDKGDSDYFDEKGQSLKKSLLKTPVDGARLSGRFGARKHPVLGYTRLHKGLDFAAPQGTPIMAAGNGTIERANRYGSFGNYIRIQHNDGLKTAYAHLHHFAKGMKKGRRVRQGEIIGYIGTTGRSTGPHLHYEILKGQKQVNPFNLKFPTARRLASKTMEDFQKERHLLVEQIEKLASLDPLFAAYDDTGTHQEAENTQSR